MHFDSCIHLNFSQCSKIIFLPNFNWQLGYSAIERSVADFYMEYKLLQITHCFAYVEVTSFINSVLVCNSNFNVQSRKLKCELSHKPLRQAVMV